MKDRLLIFYKARIKLEMGNKLITCYQISKGRNKNFAIFLQNHVLRNNLSMNACIFHEINRLFSMMKS